MNNGEPLISDQEIRRRCEVIAGDVWEARVKLDSAVDRLRDLFSEVDRPSMASDKIGVLFNARDTLCAATLAVWLTVDRLNLCRATFPIGVADEPDKGLEQ